MSTDFRGSVSIWLESYGRLQEMDQEPDTVHGCAFVDVRQ
jgi:hypothetical protein